MAYITLGQFIYSGVNRDTLLILKDRYNKVIRTCGVKEVDECLKSEEIYEITAVSANQIMLKLDTICDLD